ncbi:transposase [Streptomyces sp. NPDC097610]|uniref:transposase n=1 Tax=Streptomyces sp. NPDC097610 TaxID=3157227 RepID=UPI003330F3F1
MWELFRQVIPETAILRPQGGGRCRVGDRETFAAIVFVATPGCIWQQLPRLFGPCRRTVYCRFAQWSRDRVRARPHRVMLDHAEGDRANYTPARATTATTCADGFEAEASAPGYRPRQPAVSEQMSDESDEAEGFRTRSPLRRFGRGSGQQSVTTRPRLAARGAVRSPRRPLGRR